MFTRNRTLLATCAAIALVVTACGDDGGDADQVTTAAPTESMAADSMTAETMTAETIAGDTMPVATEAPTESMTDETMPDETMTDDSMTDETMPGEAMADSTEAVPASDGPFGPACGAVPTEGEGSFAGMTDDPAATAASNNPLLSTLVAAVTEAGLVDTLNSDGPFTIFAPTNDAFAAIPPDDLDAVLADKELLTGILTYHVIAGESLDAAALGEAGTATAVNGAELTFGADGTTVNGTDVLCSNVMTANATVHIIGEVLMPS